MKDRNDFEFPTLLSSIIQNNIHPPFALTDDAWVSGTVRAPQKFLLSQKFRFCDPGFDTGFDPVGRYAPLGAAINSY